MMMAIDSNIANNIIQLTSAWEKAQGISTKIENQLAAKQTCMIDLSNTQISIVEKFPSLTTNEIDRDSVLKYLKSTIQAIEHDKSVILMLYQTFSMQQEFINEFGIMAVSQLLTNLVNLDKELVKMSKIVSDVLLNWENLDFNKSTLGEGVDEHSLVSADNNGFTNINLDSEDETS